jgi:hypothetical protein
MGRRCLRLVFVSGGRGLWLWVWARLEPKQAAGGRPQARKTKSPNRLLASLELHCLWSTKAWHDLKKKEGATNFPCHSKEPEVCPSNWAGGWLWLPAAGRGGLLLPACSLPLPKSPKQADAPWGVSMKAAGFSYFHRSAAATTCHCRQLRPLGDDRSRVSGRPRRFGEFGAWLCGREKLLAPLQKVKTTLRNMRSVRALVSYTPPSWIVGASSC